MWGVCEHGITISVECQGQSNTLPHGNTLNLQQPKNEPADVYVYNPMNPVPTPGGNTPGGGYRDHRPRIDDTIRGHPFGMDAEMVHRHSDWLVTVYS